MRFRPTNCPKCKSENYQSVASRDSKALGREGYRLCLSCGEAYRPPNRNFTEQFSFRPSSSVKLLPEIGGKPSDALQQWLKESHSFATASVQTLRRTSGYALLGLGGVLTLGGAGVIWAQIKPSALHGSGPRVDFGIVGGVVAAFVCCFGFSLMQFARKLCARRATQVLAKDSRCPILFLRSFDDDEIALPKPRPKRSNSVEELYFGLLPSPSDRNTLEHTIVEAFQAIGPVIAIGAPGQVIAPSGAARTWYPHDIWELRVQDLTAWSQRVVMVLGDLERKGLAWEAEHLLTMVSLQKVVLVIPPQVTPTENARRWQLLRNKTQDRLPDYRPGTIALYFLTPNRLIRISLASGLELTVVPNDHLVSAYERAMVNVRDFSWNKDARLLIEEFPWAAMSPRKA